MPLSSSSTLEQIEAAYDDNGSYAENQSPTQARAFVTACRLLLRRTPKESGNRESHMTLSPELIQGEMLTAQRWLEANDTSGQTGGPRVTGVSFETFR